MKKIIGIGKQLDKERREKWFQKYAWRFRHSGPSFPDDVSFDNVYLLEKIMENKTTDELYSLPEKNINEMADRSARQSYLEAGDNWAKMEMAKKEALKRIQNIVE